MNNCCSNHKSKTAPCPVNGKYYKQVKRKTILHHVTRPWSRKLPEQAYYYCSDPDCDVIYFGKDNSMLTSSDMRLSDIKRSNTICFCFDISKEDLKKENELTKTFVVEQTRHSTCDCEIRNPSGKCCLKNFS